MRSGAPPALGSLRAHAAAYLFPDPNLLAAVIAAVDAELAAVRELDAASDLDTRTGRRRFAYQVELLERALVILRGDDEPAVAPGDAIEDQACELLIVTRARFL